MSPAAGPDLSMFNRFSKTFRKGDIIFCEYEPGDTFYLIQAGRVQVVRITSMPTMPTAGGRRWVIESSFWPNRPAR